MASIDGVKTDIIRANYVLRALQIPAGEHTVTFEFKPAVYSYGNTVTIISTVFILLIFFGTLAIELRLINPVFYRK